MGQFRGTEPLVGEVRGLRTFRVDDSGLLLPLYSNEAWYDGANTAVCSPPTGDHRRSVHPVPSDECECGFYAYGTVEASRQNRNTRYVQAVVSCWGAVVAGTQGVRAQHARIEAIWLHPEAPRWLRHRVGSRYPSARTYAAVEAMLNEHPLTALSCYEQSEPARRGPRVAGAAVLSAMLALGLLPAPVVHGTAVLFALWLLVTVFAIAVTGWLVVGSHGVGHLAAAFVMAGVVAWMIAPLFGVAGWLLRVPLLRGLAVAAGGYLLALRPRHFPVVTTPRERAFYGVHP